MMTDAVGRTSRLELEIFLAYGSNLGKTVAKKELGDGALAGCCEIPQRIKCATLGWNALKRAIEEDKSKM